MNEQMRKQLRNSCLSVLSNQRAHAFSSIDVEFKEQLLPLLSSYTENGQLEELYQAITEDTENPEIDRMVVEDWLEAELVGIISGEVQKYIK